MLFKSSKNSSFLRVVSHKWKCYILWEIKNHFTSVAHTQYSLRHCHIIHSSKYLYCSLVRFNWIQLSGIIEFHLQKLCNGLSAISWITQSSIASFLESQNPSTNQLGEELNIFSLFFPSYGARSSCIFCVSVYFILLIIIK